MAPRSQNYSKRLRLSKRRTLSSSYSNRFDPSHSPSSVLPPLARSPSAQDGIMPAPHPHLHLHLRSRDLQGSAGHGFLSTMAVSSNIQIADDPHVERKPIHSNLHGINTRQGEGPPSSTTPPPLSVRIADRHVCKRKKMTWELACTLAYAYVHGQPLQRSHQAMDAYADGEGYRKTLAPSSCSLQQHNLTDIVNPTQAAEWLKGRFLSANVLIT